MTTDLACKVYVDWGKDGAFTTAGDDISAYWQSTTITAGARAADQHCADVGRCTLVLNNEDRLFSPDYAAGTYYESLVPRLPIRVDATDGVTDWMIFRGWVESWAPESGHIHGNRTCIVQAVDGMGLLQDAGISQPLQENETASTILTKICASAFGGTIAEGSAVFEDKITDGQTIQVGARVYTFKDTLTGIADEILIGDSTGYDLQDQTADNLAAAINGEAGAGTNYGTGTVRHQYVTAESTTGMGVTSDQRTGWVALRDAASNYEALANRIILGDTDLEIATLKLYLQKVGSPTGTVTIRIETDSAGDPSGTLCDANATITVDEADLAAGGGWITVTFPGTISLDLYKRYHVVLTTDRGSSGVNYINWGIDTVAPFAFVLKLKTAGVWANASPTTQGVMLSPATITLSANARGAWGNALDLITDSSVITLNDATLTGGADAPSGLTSFETGQTFPLAADGWAAERTNGLRAAQEIADGEYGLFYCAPDGTLTFKGYQWCFEQQAVAASITLDNTPHKIDPRVSIDNIANEIIVEYVPRREADVGVIAQSNGVIVVPPKSGTKRRNSTVTPGANTVKLAYLESATGNIVGATSIIAPVSGTDYSVFTGPGSGNLDITAKDLITVTLAINGGDLEATFKNPTWVYVFIHDFQVRGTALIAYDKQLIVLQDATSIAAYGLKTMRIRLPVCADRRFAEAVAAYELVRRKDPHTLISRMDFRNTREINGTHLYSIAPGDTVAISDTQTAIDSHKYLIHGWNCSLDVSGAHGLTWYVRRMDDNPTWILENATYSLLEDTTRLGL